MNKVTFVGFRGGDFPNCPLDPPLCTPGLFKLEWSGDGTVCLRPRTYFASHPRRPTKKKRSPTNRPNPATSKRPNDSTNAKTVSPSTPTSTY